MKRNHKKFLVVIVALVCALSVFVSACNIGGGKKHEHSFVNFVYNNDATCLNDGTETAKCEGCDETYRREKEGTKLPHSFVTYVSNSDATCTANGTETAKCENCNAIDTREKADSKTPHSFITYVFNDDATCTANGTETAKCDNCVATDTREKADSKLPHSFTNFIPDGNATTESDGTKTAKCDFCTATKTVTDEGSKLDGEHVHSYTEEVIDPTCTEKGYTFYRCGCGNAEYKDDFVDELGHSFTNYVSNNDATTESDGTKTAKCDRCDETDTITDEGTKLPSPDDGEIVEGTKDEVSDSNLSIHFLELGNKYTGDCTLIKCGDTEVLIDAGSRKSSAVTINTYLSQYVSDGVIEYVISTHSDEDHISGLLGNKSGSTRNGVAYEYDIGTFIKFDKAGTDGNGKPLVTDKGNQTLYSEYVDMVEYLAGKGTAVYTASQCYEEKDGAQRQYYLDENESISINILYNYYYYNASSDENNYSVVTLLTQELAGGNKYYLFSGDLEEGGESRMVDYYKNSANSKSEYDILPQVELFKAGHHGSKTSSTAKLLEVIRPKTVVVCCCCGSPEYTQNNANTFPTQTMIDNVSKYTDKIYVTTLATGLPEKDENGNYTSKKFDGYTSMNGNIVFYYTDRLKMYCSNNNTILKETEWFKENRSWNTQS